MIYGPCKWGKFLKSAKAFAAGGKKKFPPNLFFKTKTKAKIEQHKIDQARTIFMAGLDSFKSTGRKNFGERCFFPEEVLDFCKNFQFFLENL